MTEGNAVRVYELAEWRYRLQLVAMLSNVAFVVAFLLAVCLLYTFAGQVFGLPAASSLHWSVGVPLALLFIAFTAESLAIRPGNDLPKDVVVSKLTLTSQWAASSLLKICLPVAFMAGVFWLDLSRLPDPLGSVGFFILWLIALDQSSTYNSMAGWGLMRAGFLRDVPFKLGKPQKTFSIYLVNPKEVNAH